MSKIYILLKSLPDNSVGDLFSYNDRTGYYEHGTTKFLPRVVENNPEWFVSFYKHEDKMVFYTEQDMRECFRNSRRMGTPVNSNAFSWDTFDQYMGHRRVPPYKIPNLPPHK